MIYSHISVVLISQAKTTWRNATISYFSFVKISVYKYWYRAHERFIKKRRTVCSALKTKDARTVFPEAYQNAIPPVLILKSCNETYILDIKFLPLSGNIGPFKFIPLFCATPLKLQKKISRNFVEKTPC